MDLLFHFVTSGLEYSGYLKLILDEYMGVPVYQLLTKLLFVLLFPEESLI